MSIATQTLWRTGVSNETITPSMIHTGVLYYHVAFTAHMRRNPVRIVGAPASMRAHKVALGGAMRNSRPVFVRTRAEWLC